MKKKTLIYAVHDFHYLKSRFMVTIHWNEQKNSYTNMSCMNTGVIRRMLKIENFLNKI